MTVNFPLTVQLVMIDLDGTMIDTAPDIVAAANLMLRDLGHGARDAAAIRGWIGNGVERLVKRALTGEKMDEPDPKLFEAALALFRQHYGAHLSGRSRPYPGAVEGLAALQRTGFQLVCITNKTAAFTEPLLRALDLRRFFRLVLSGDSLPAKKPDPLPLTHACRHFQVTPEHAVLVGDSTNDVAAARAAGMPVICVPYGYNHGDDIRAAGPDLMIDTLADLPHYLKLYA